MLCWSHKFVSLITWCLSGVGGNDNKGATTSSQDLQNWSLTIRCSLVSYFLIMSHRYSNDLFDCRKLNEYMGNAHVLLIIHDNCNSLFLFKKRSLIDQWKTHWNNCVQCQVNILFIFHFCLGKYSFSLDTFWTHLILISFFFFFNKNFYLPQGPQIVTLLFQSAPLSFIY